MQDLLVSLANMLDILGFLAKKSKSFLEFLSMILKNLAKFCDFAKNNCQDLGEKCQKSKKNFGKKSKTPSIGLAKNRKIVKL